jgi:TolB-like protein
MGQVAEGSLLSGTVGSHAIPAGAILEQLQRVVESEVFRRSDRLRRLLLYIVEQTIGATGQLDEPSIRAAVFVAAGPPRTADSPLVRVETHRLRSKLAEYYATAGREDPIEIALVHRGYSAIFRNRMSPARPAPAGVSKCLLVRRFDNLEGRSKGAIFIAGFTAELLYALTQLHGLRVIAGNPWSVERIKDALARGDIDAVLNGTVRLHGRCLRLGVQVTRADGTVMWSEIFERGRADLATQQTIASSIAGSVRESLGMG